SGSSTIAVSYLKGDVNINGQLDVADISAMMIALINLASFQSVHGLSNADMITLFDVDSSTSINNLDVQDLICLVANSIVSGGAVSATASDPSDASIDSEIVEPTGDETNSDKTALVAFVPDRIPVAPPTASQPTTQQSVPTQPSLTLNAVLNVKM